MKNYLLLLIGILFLSTTLNAQGKYAALSARGNQPSIHFDNVLLPNPDSEEVTYALIFSFGYDFLPFKKINPGQEIPAPEGKSFFTTARLSTEIFKGSGKDRDLSKLQSVTLETWSDTVYASNFEETQSNKYFESGALVARLIPGKYNYVLQLSAGGQTRERNSNRREIEVPDFSSKKTGEVYLIKSADTENPSKPLQLMNMGDNVPFGKDFYTLVRIPNYQSTSSYSMLIESVRTEQKDTTLKEQKYSLEIAEEDIQEKAVVELADKKHPALKITEHANGYAYVLMKIPNSELENDSYRIKVVNNDTQEVVAKRIFRSFWANMPPALYSLDFSLDMLKFIISEEELDQLREGNRREKEEKFREFWSSKDPTPNTVFNELMAEYYRRVDYAYNNFSSMQVPGYENDQGQIYIKYGPPKSVDRTFPQSGPAREVWDYGNQKFVFEATSGFGDFVLVSSSAS